MAVEHEGKNPPTSFLRWIRWTGFPDKTLWDLMQLPIVPIVLGAGAIWFQRTIVQRGIEEDRTRVQLAIEEDRSRQDAFQSYLASISTLLLDKKLDDPEQDTAVREIARAITISTLSQLDADRKGQLITFLFDSRLIGYTDSPSERDEFGGDSSNNDSDKNVLFIIDLYGADLTGANLHDTFLEGVDLFGVDMTGAILTKAHLKNATLASAEMNGTNLQEANLTGADLTFASLENSDLTGATVENEQIAMAEFFEGLTLNDGSRIESDEEMIAFKQ